MDTWLGLIQLFPYTYVPRGWKKCDGALLQIQQNTALFSLIGIKFGGDGQRTFALPNLTGFSPDSNLVYCIATEGIYPSRP
ncbi:MAG: tail fiber protein [Syntrophomonadaceae bacterium]|nr:tail fiber protein [Syntrophomonadaceae bacterium]